MLPAIWLLEIKKTMNYQSQNQTQVEDIKISGVGLYAWLFACLFGVSEVVVVFLLLRGYLNVQC
jgi:hypothetical protein